MTGMMTDMNVSRFSSDKLLDARNIRITQTNEGQELYCVTNEKGTTLVSLTVENGSRFTFPQSAKLIGTAEFEDYLVMFATSGTTDYIFRVDKNNNVVRTLFQGHIGLNEGADKFETLAVYENKNVQKVYWIDGIHQLRVINIIGDSIISDDANYAGFDSNPRIKFNHSITVTKNDTGGEFPAGTVQYAFTYHNLYSPETNIFETTPLYLLSTKSAGVAADGRTTCSFRISFESLDDTFEFIRVYAIVRTSENAAPNVRILGDFDTKTTKTVIDTGSTGTTVDASALLFTGGEPIAASTFTAKGGTLMLGNIKLLKASLSNVDIDNTTLKESVKELRVLNEGYIPSENDYGESQFVDTIDYDLWSYDYTPDNNVPSIFSRTFKWGETYRLGIIAQHDTGVWSDVLWLGDFENKICPYFAKDVKDSLRGVFRVLLSNKVMDALRSNNFVRVAPVVVYPEGTDRTVFCQGLVSATVFNIEDRYYNRPSSQASWFFRPLQDYWCHGYSEEGNYGDWGLAGIPFTTLNSMKRTTTENIATSGTEFSFSDKPRFYLPEKFMETSKTAADFVAMMGNEFMIDTETVTLNSPDIELDDSLQQEDFTGLKFRVVGYAATAPWNKNMSYFTEISNPLSYVTGSKMLSYDDFKALTYSPTGVGIYRWYTYVDRPAFYLGVHTETDQDLHTLTLSPWHGSGNLGQNEDNQYYHLDKNITAQCWYANTYLDDSVDNVFKGVEVDTYTPRLFDQTQQQIVVFDDVEGSPVYYGNIDKVLTYHAAGISSSESDQVHLNNAINPSERTGSNNRTGQSRGLRFEDNWYLTYKAQDYVHNSRMRYYMDVYFGIIPGLSTAPLECKNPIPLKYKSTKHAVIRMRSEQDHIKPLYAFSGYHGYENGGLSRTFNCYYTNKQCTIDEGYFDYGDALNEWIPRQSFIRGNRVVQPCSWDGTSTPPKDGTADIPILYIGELYRDVDPSVRFGGNTDSAMLSNVWRKAGPAVKLDDYVTFFEGDTYLTRYDCLKTYPYTEEDVNQVIEIFSTHLETRVNLDARYDKTRNLVDNTLIRPENTNLVNRLGYEQTNSFFTYGVGNSRTEGIDDFETLIAISGEKTSGSEVDSWGNITLTATQDADGRYGPIEALRTFNDNIFVFQNNAFGQVLFNERVQIPTSDGIPIEISSGTKLQGIRYIDNTVGCADKKTLAISGNKMYWYYNKTGCLYSFSGQQLDNMSVRLGVRNISHKYNKRTVFDKVTSDVYFFSDNEALMYSENMDSFVSRFDYKDVFTIYSTKNTSRILTGAGAHWDMFTGAYNSLLGTTYPYMIKLVANQYPTMHKVFDTIQWRSDSWSGNTYLPMHTFNKVRAYNQYQDSGYVNLVDVAGKPSILKKKFNTFRTLTPRDTLNKNSNNRDRIRGNYSIVELTNDLLDNNKFQLYDIEITEFV